MKINILLNYPHQKELYIYINLLIKIINSFLSGMHLYYGIEIHYFEWNL